MAYLRYGWLGSFPFGNRHLLRFVFLEHFPKNTGKWHATLLRLIWGDLVHLLGLQRGAELAIRFRVNLLQKVGKFLVQCVLKRSVAGQFRQVGLEVINKLPLGQNHRFGVHFKAVRTGGICEAPKTHPLNTSLPHRLDFCGQMTTMLAAICEKVKIHNRKFGSGDFFSVRRGIGWST